MIHLDTGSLISALRRGSAEARHLDGLAAELQQTYTTRAILKINFTPEDHRRVDELSAKAQKGTLTPEERAELEEYVRVDLKLTVLRSKAQMSLKRANTSP